MRAFRCLLSLSALCVVCLANGCSAPRVNVTHTPAGRNALGTVPPRSVSLEVEDHRPADERATVAGIIKFSKVQTQTNLTAIVRSALKAEFEQNGHRVVEANSSAAADFIIRVQIARFFARTQTHLETYFEIIGMINSQVSILQAGGAGSKAVPVNGTHRLTSWYLRGKWEQALKAAFENYVANFCSDPQIIDALRQ